MHILILAPEAIPVPPIRGGSVETCIHHIAKHITGPHQITIISKRHPRYLHKQTSGSIQHIRIQGGKPNRYLERAIPVIRKQAFDIIQIDNRPKFLPKVKACFPNRPVVLFLHSETFLNPPYNTNRKAAAQLKHAQLIVANSQSLQQRLIARFPEHRHKIHYVHLGVNSRQFHPPGIRERNQARRKYNIPHKFTVLFTGRLIPRKGIPTLIRAMRIVRRTIPGAQLIIAGRAHARSYLNQLKRTGRIHKVPIRYLGNIAHRRMHEVYWLGDVFACPSQKHEAFGLVVAEAMASGLPVVASRIGGIPEILNHRVNGWLVNNYSAPASFATAITTLAKDKQLTSALTDKAREDMLARFNWKRTADQLVNLYQTHIQKGG